MFSGVSLYRILPLPIALGGGFFRHWCQSFEASTSPGKLSAQNVTAIVLSLFLCNKKTSFNSILRESDDAIRSLAAQQILVTKYGRHFSRYNTYSFLN